MDWIFDSMIAQWLIAPLTALLMVLETILPTVLDVALPAKPATGDAEAKSGAARQKTKIGNKNFFLIYTLLNKDLDSRYTKIFC